MDLEHKHPVCNNIIHNIIIRKPLLGGREESVIRFFEKFYNKLLILQILNHIKNIYSITLDFGSVLLTVKVK